MSIITKFGGTSVRDRASWQTIANIVSQSLANQEQPIVVCSALPGISDDLEKLLKLTPQGQHHQHLQHIIQRYLDFGAELEVDTEALIQDDLNQLKQLSEGIALTGELSASLHARILSFGEIMLTRLGAAFLQQQGIACTWLDARDLLHSVTDTVASTESNILTARCDDQADPDLQKKINAISGAVLTQGFIASDRQGKTVLLGRGGSDASAAYFAAKCQATRCEIWTDVPGIYTTNPRWVPQARLLKSLSYEEALEIAAAGAKVLHPKCIGPLMRNDIPCHIRCTHAPERESTVVTSQIPFVQPHVKAIAKRSHVTLVVMETTGMWQQVGFLADVFACFKQHGISVDLISTSEKNVTVSIDTSAVVTQDMLDQLCSDLAQYCRTRIVANAASISLVGRNIRAILHHLTPIFESFAEQKMYMLTQAANDLNLTVVVDEEQAEKMVQKLHALLFEKHHQLDFLGETWEVREQLSLEALTDWWVQKREALLEHMQTHDAQYIYDSDTIQNHISQLTSLQAIDQVFYAMKANPHPGVLQLVYENDMGFECVSLGEVDVVLGLFPQLDRKRILFTPNFAPLSEYQQALAQGFYVNCDNLQPLLDNPEVFAQQELILRIDPGVGRGHHQYVKTGGSQSKFGITIDELQQAKSVFKQNGIKVIGLHAHSGSGVLNPDNWDSVAKLLLHTAADFPDVRIINLGGGLGVPERFGQPPLDMPALDASLLKIKQAYPDKQFWLEPGRFVVASAGVLLARVTQLKQKQHIHYVGVATGMNSLIRPALYGAHHEIVNLSRLSAPRTLTANVVGPICESGDTLGYDRLLPETQVGDVLLIANAGAYGHCMGSNYNSRPPAAEFCW